MLSNRDRQRRYVIEIYKDGAACFACGKIQTPWQAQGVDTETWLDTKGPEREYHCIECGVEMRHDVLLMGGWRWGNPALKVHR